MKRRGQIGIAIALTTAAFGAQAAGLGRLNLMSGLGQPLRAEIDLTSVTRDEAGSLTAKLAGADAFSQASIEYGSALSGLRFSIQRRANGQPYVLVTSNQIVNEPYLDLLVELTWSSGRLVREYTMLLDPPESRAARTETEPRAIVQAQPAASSAAAPASSQATTSSSSTTSSSDAAIAAPRARRTAPRVAPRIEPEARETSGSEYRVRPGDTAISIARTNKPDSVSLEQMLAALYSGNPRAFSGNINRLLAGATMRIPDAAAAQAVDRSDAHRIIVAQSSNFGGYRDRVARDATQVPTSRSAGQQAGKLTTRVEDSAAPGVAKDRLELSRADSGKAGADATKAGADGTKANASAVRGTLNAPAVDEIAAKERELQETKSRLALLEKNVADLQKLLQLKNQTLADLQKGNDVKTADAGVSAAPTAAPATTVLVPAPSAATPVTPSAPMPAPSSPTGTSPAPALTSEPTSSPATSSTTSPKTATPAIKATTKPVPAAAPESNWFEQLMDNTLLAIGTAILLALLIGYGLYTMARRRKLARFEDSIFVDNSVLRSNSLFGTTGGQSVDTANTGFHSNFVPVAGNLPEQNEVDPVAEADVYIAYGRDAQAEEILKEALRADPARHAVRLKLLEIYAKRGDTKTFETIASELYAATGGQGDEWKQAAALGANIDSHNPLYREAPPATVSPSLTAPSPSPAFGSTATSALTAAPGSSVSALGAGLGGAALGAAAGLTASNLDMRHSTPSTEPAAPFADLTRTDPLPRIEPTPVPSAAPAMDLDFNLGLTDIGLSSLDADDVSTSIDKGTAPATTTRTGGLDFDVGESPKSMIEPFTASAFGVSDPTARTAVNLPAFRARAEQEPKPVRHVESDNFTASDIFGSSISADTQPMEDYSAEPPLPPGAPAQDTHAFDSHQFDRTEQLPSSARVNLDLDRDYEATEVRSNDATKTDVWQAMATKLDLAMAYRDIGDTDGARELLEEVVRSGDPVQADRARELIGELG